MVRSCSVDMLNLFSPRIVDVRSFSAKGNIRKTGCDGGCVGELRTGLMWLQGSIKGEMENA